MMSCRSFCPHHFTNLSTTDQYSVTTPPCTHLQQQICVIQKHRQSFKSTLDMTLYVQLLFFILAWTTHACSQCLIQRAWHWHDLRCMWHNKYAIVWCFCFWQSHRHYTRHKVKPSFIMIQLQFHKQVSLVRVGNLVCSGIDLNVSYGKAEAKNQIKQGIKQIWDSSAYCLFSVYKPKDYIQEYDYIFEDT